MYSIFIIIIMITTANCSCCLVIINVSVSSILCFLYRNKTCVGECVAVPKYCVRVKGDNSRSSEDSNRHPSKKFFLHLRSCRRPDIELSKFYRRSLSRSAIIDLTVPFRQLETIHF